MRSAGGSSTRWAIPCGTSGSRSESRRGPSRAIRSAATFAGYSGTGLAFTRDDGEFTISGLTAGNLHRLTVIADGWGAGEVDRVEAQPVGRLKPADAVTIKLAAPHSLRVRVFRAEGKLVEGARVTVIQNEARGGFQWGYSDSSWDDSVTARVDARGWADVPLPGLRQGHRRREGQGLRAHQARLVEQTRRNWRSSSSPSRG